MTNNNFRNEVTEKIIRTLYNERLTEYDSFYDIVSYQDISFAKRLLNSDIISVHDIIYAICGKNALKLQNKITAFKAISNSCGDKKLRAEFHRLLANIETEFFEICIKDKKYAKDILKDLSIDKICRIILGLENLIRTHKNSSDNTRSILEFLLKSQMRRIVSKKSGTYISHMINRSSMKKLFPKTAYKKIPPSQFRIAIKHGIENIDHCCDVTKLCPNDAMKAIKYNPAFLKEHDMSSWRLKPRHWKTLLKNEEVLNNIQQDYKEVLVLMTLKGKL